jgi:hypothetical protein
MRHSSQQTGGVKKKADFNETRKLNVKRGGEKQHVK